MRLHQIDRFREGDTQVLRCSVDWEDCARPSSEIRFSLPVYTGLTLDPCADAFLLAALAPAFAAGEQRLRVEGALCPQLLQNLPTALAILRQWFPQDFASPHNPRLEGNGARAARHPPADASFAFYSGGVDSTHLLLAHSATLAAPQPQHLRHVLSVQGFDIGGRVGQDGSATFAAFCQSAQPLLDSRSLQLLPLSTNLRHLDDRPGFWGHSFVGFALAAVAQLMGQHFARALLATPGEPLSAPIQAPFGTHPTLAIYSNSADMPVLMPYLEISRFQRLGLIAHYPLALAALRVCFFSDEGRPNCGRCEKCVRTQLGLRLHGIDPAVFFSDVVLDAGLIDQTDLGSDSSAAMVEEMLAQLQGPAWRPLRQAVLRQLARWQRHKRWREGRTLGGRLRSLKRRWLDGG